MTESGIKSWTLVANAKKVFRIENTNYIPRVGESVSYRGSLFHVTEIIYDFEEGTVWVWSTVK